MTISNIEILINEHNNIKKILKILKCHCIGLLNNPNYDLKFFYDFINFSKNYADKHHHQKEELILFDYMIKYLGIPAKKLISNGMLVEHDLGRYYIRLLESALETYAKTKKDADRLELLTAAMAYSELLIRHINKENDVVYPFAIKNLSQASLIEIENKTIAYEEKYKNIKNFYENFIDKLYKNKK